LVGAVLACVLAAGCSPGARRQGAEAPAQAGVGGRGARRRGRGPRGGRRGSWGRRASITLYKVREPDPAASRAELLATYRLRYPDPDAGCRGWDAESLFLVGGLPYVITKTGFPVVYRAATLDPRRTTVLRRVGGLASGVTEPVVFPTGADLDVAHSRLAVATYATLAIYQASKPSLSGEALVAELIGHPARWTVQLGCLICPVSQLSMVEGVAFTGRAEDLTLLSERHDVWYVPTAAYER